MKNENYDLLICGTGPLEDSIRESIKEIETIKLMGQVEHNELMNLLSNAKALLFTSVWYETFGMAIIEAYSCGVPVIVNDIGNGAQLVVNKITGLKYKDGDKESLKKAINEITSLDLKKNILNEYKDKYTDVINEKKLIELYDLMSDKSNDKN